MTYRECYEQGCRTLQAAGIEEAALDARLLLEAVCGTDRNDLLVHGEQPVAPEAEEKYLNWIRQRAEHIPLQQLTGEQGFMGLTFSVNEHVLIPRQDTEILVEEVLKELHDGMRVLDMCTGSGCILLSLLHYSNDCEGLGVDLSAEALEVAGRNVLKVLTPEKAEHAHFLQSDLFEKVEGKFEIIVSNPPYKKPDSGEMDKNETRAVSKYELKLTLDELIENARRLLKFRGKFYMVHRADRMAECIYKLKQNNIEPKVMTLVYPKAEKSPDVVIYECIKGASEGVKINTLIVYDENGEYTALARKMYSKD